MHTYIELKGVSAYYLIRLKTGWEFGIPPGYQNAEDRLLEALRAQWPSATINGNPNRRTIDATLMYGPTSWALADWSLITDQTHWGYSTMGTSLDQIIQCIKDKLDKSN